MPFRKEFLQGLLKYIAVVSILALLGFSCKRYFEWVNPVPPGAYVERGDPEDNLPYTPRGT